MILSVTRYIMGTHGDLYLTLFMLICTVKCDNYISVNENTTVYLNCGNRINNPVVKSKWLDPTGADATMSVRFTIGTNGSLLIKSVRRYDAGQYTCNSRIKTSRGLTPKSVVIYLNVKYAPTITVIQPYIRVFQNASVVLPCSAKGNPGVTFQWQYPNKTVIKDSTKHLLFTNGSLLVRNVQKTDVFTYTCAPYNGVGEGLYGYTYLAILIPPKFQDRVKKKIDVIEGDSTTLSCNASGIPKPNVTWTHLNVSINSDRGNVSVIGFILLKNVKGVDAGVYVCNVESIAGKLERSFVVNVIGKPIVPTQFTVITLAKFVHVTWKPAYNGGSSQEFELWYRASYKSDYEWIIMFDNSSDHKILIRGDKITDRVDLYHYYSLRARNVKGYSQFTPVIKALALSDPKLIGARVELSNNPLAPYKLTVNMSTHGYNLTWQYMFTPGRPPSYRFIIEYRVENSTSGWKEFRPCKRSRRSVAIDEDLSVNVGETTMVDILVKDIGDTGGPLEFQVSSATKDNIRSTSTKPSAVFKTGMPAGSEKGDDQKATQSTSDGDDDDLIPAVVLGSIFGLFVIILIVSLYCFCRRKKRCQARKNGTNHSETNGATKMSTYVEYNDSGGKAHEIKFSADSPRRFHVRTCPALQLGKSTTNNNNVNGVNGDTKRQTDDVFILMEPNAKEKLICTCNKKYFTLDHREYPKKNAKKKVLYKSSSSPSILLASETEDTPVDTTELLADEDFDVSELEEDVVAELDSTRIPQLERSEFKDSYDPFCRSESIDVSFKDVGNVNTSTLEKPLMPNSKDSSTSKDADVSSSGTVESERSGIPKLTKEPHRDSKSSDGKSSGYGEGIPSNVSSNNFENFNPITRFVPLASRSDIGYYSDASSRLSPLEFMNNKYHPSQRNKYATIGHNTQYFSEDEAVLHGSLHRPAKPPSYTQAIVDIERMSEKSEKTDSEKSFDHLLEMERQLGVRLVDSDDSDLTTKSLMTCRYRHSIPRSYFLDTGYTSDIQSGAWKDKYTNREKTLRCNQLLEEFKSTRKSDQATVDNPVPLSPTRPYSLVDNIIPEEEVVKRKTSSTSMYNEWLV